MILAQKPDVITGKQEHRNRQLSALIVNIETDVQDDERIMTAIARSKARARCKAMAKCNAKICELADSKVGDNFQSP